MRRSTWTLAAAARGALGALVLAFALPAVSSSCAGKLRGDPASYQVSRSTSGTCDAIPVFTRHCATAACHVGDNATGGLDLSAAGIESRLVGVKSQSNGCQDRLLIDPSAPDKSFLLEKIDERMPSCGVRMPLVGDLSAEERACIHTWVLSLVASDGGDAGHSGRTGSGDASVRDASVRDAAGSP
jgi:hypothetical protein